MRSRAFWSMVAVCAFLPAARAQPTVGVGVGIGTFGYPYGPRIGPPWGWGYPGLYGGPFVGYPGYYGRYGFPGYYGGFGFPYYSGRAGSVWSNGLSLYGPPVPVPGSVPGVFGNDDLVRQWRSTLWPGYAGFGWIGISVAGPRPRYPSVGPVVESVSTGPFVPVPAAKVGGCLIISVKVPQPAAEVLVDGHKTALTGTDRIFETPPLEAGRTYRYTVTARWLERGQVVETSREVTGTPGEVVRVDFGAPVPVTKK